MRQRKWIVGSVIVLLLFGLIWFWTERRASQVGLEPLPIERKRIGAFKKPANTFGAFFHASIVDYDGNGEPELLTYFQSAGAGGGLMSPKMTCWMSLENGATTQTPLIALLPSRLTTPNTFEWLPQFRQGELPLLRETIAWDSATRRAVRLRYADGKWQSQPIAELKGEQIQNALGVDLDGDGVVGEYFLQTDTGKLAHLRVDEANHLQFETLKSVTPAPIQQLIDNSPVGGIPIARGGAPPTMVHPTAYSLRDLDGDGKPEKLFLGGGAARKPASLRLSTNSKLLQLPVQGVRLVNQIDTAEVDGDPQAELLILQNRLGQITIQVYEIVQGALKPKGLPTQLPASPTALWFIRDLDGDGKVEIIIADDSGKPTRMLRWLVLQAHNGQFQEIARYQQRLPESASLDRAALETRRGIALDVYRASTLAQIFGGSLNMRTVLVGFPSGKDALNPVNWQFAYLRDTSPLWAGDYDGDGVEELITGHHWGAAIYLVQFCDGAWRGVKLGEGGMSAVLPVRLKGAPWLALLSYEGQVEAIRIRPASGK